MNALTNLFALDCIALDSTANNRADAFAAAGELFSKHAGIDSNAVVGFLNAREDLGSTALGAGVAIPHGRVKGLKQPIAAFIKLKNSIEFAAKIYLPESQCDSKHFYQSKFCECAFAHRTHASCRACN